jgi:DNA repair protein RecO (recombination protein O)
MHWEDVGIVLSARVFAERDATVTLLTRSHGLWRALARGGRGNDQRGIWEPGNLVLARWNARLPEHLGAYSGELLHAVAALLMEDRRALACLASALALLESSLHERDPHPVLYEHLRHLLSALCTEHADGAAEYLRFELELLKETGFGLDLARCAATGSTEELCYLSPKTGRAVSREAGLPWHDRLLPLPASLRDPASASPGALHEALHVTGYFLTQHLYAPRGKPLPAARAHWAELCLGLPAETSALP